MVSPSVPVSDFLSPFSDSDRKALLPLTNQLRQAIGDDHLFAIQNELFEVLTKIVGNLPLNSAPVYFYPGSYNEYSLKLSIIVLNLLRQRIQFFTMPLDQKEFETQLLKLFCLILCFFLNLRITAMTFSIVAENGDEYRFEVPYAQWFKEHEGQALRLYHNIDPEAEASGGNINRLVLKYLPDSIQKRFAKSFKKGYVALLSKFIVGDFGSILQDQFILILISNAEAILKEQMAVEFTKQRETSPPYIPSILSWALCALLADELSPEQALRKSDADGNREHLKIVENAITCKNGEIYAVVDHFFPLLTAKLNELFPRQTWRKEEVLRMCCQCGIFDLKEGATFEEVSHRIEMYKKGGKEVACTPVKGLRFNNFLWYVPRNCYWHSTVQSLHAKHSLNANDKKLRELGLHAPLAKAKWEQKRILFEREKAKHPFVPSIPKNEDDTIKLMREEFVRIMEDARKKKLAAEKALKEAKEAQVAPAILAQLKADFDRSKQEFEESQKKFNCEFNQKKKEAKEKQKQPQEASSEPINANEPTKPSEPEKEMSNTELIIIENNAEPQVRTIQTPYAIKASGKHIFNAICSDTGRFFRGVAACFSVHNWLAKSGYRLVKIDSEKSFPSNAQKTEEVKQTTCVPKSEENKEDSSLIIQAASATASDQSAQAANQDCTSNSESTGTSEDNQLSLKEKAATDSSTLEVNVAAATEQDSKTDRQVANPDLQKHLIRRLSASVEKASLHPEKLADMEMDEEIKRLALGEKSSSETNPSSVAKTEAKTEPAARPQVTVEEKVSKETSSSNAPISSQRVVKDAASSKSEAAETVQSVPPSTEPKKRGRKKKADTQSSNSSVKAEATTQTKPAVTPITPARTKANASANTKPQPASSAQAKTVSEKAVAAQVKAKPGRKPKAAETVKEAVQPKASIVSKTAKTVNGGTQSKPAVKPAPKTSAAKAAASKALQKASASQPSQKAKQAVAPAA